MSTERFRRDRGWVSPSMRKKGPNGRGLCRWCSTEVPPSRKTFCSARCVHEWKLRTDAQYVRAHVFARDHGVCASCGIDTEALRTALISLWRIDSRAAHANAWIHGFGNTFRSVRVGRYGPRPMSLWQADHIRPVVEGGGECGLENYRTLCLPCHHRATAELMRRRRKTTEAA